MTPQKLFVYGTLRGPAGSPRGEIGTIKGMIFDLGPFPAVIPTRHASSVEEAESRVVGEVIDMSDVDAETWDRQIQQWDRYEGVPRLYYREIVPVTLEDGSTDRAWVYLFTNAERARETAGKPIESGDWYAR